MKKFLPVLGFLAASGILTLGAFPGGISGKTILAPIDIFPNFFSHFGYIDPQADGIPENHHIIDQATYDLPLQYLIYQNIRQGILPWWDPYTFGGRPLLADAHINGTDPIRLLLYRLAPFLLAYNWNLMLKSVLTGLGMFLLLRFLGHPVRLATLLGLCFQFAGCFAIFFGHPWIQASFLYYPFLWISLDRLLKKPSGSAWIVASLLCALIFFSGNLQSHTYLLLFLLAYGASFYFRGSPDRTRALTYPGLCLVWGACLASPVLLNQLEFFLLSIRGVVPASWSMGEILRGPLSMAGAFPWLLGTFRTIDLSKAAGSGSLGFCLFVGSSTFLLALFASVRLLFRKHEAGPADCLAGLLVGGYILILSTPLGNFFYTRLSPLASMGLIILAASAISSVSSLGARFVVSPFYFFAAISFFLAAIWLWELWAFHHFHDLIRDYFLVKVQKTASSVTSAALRSFQVEAFATEVGWANLEVAFSWISLAALLFFFRERKDASPHLGVLYLSMVSSLVAVMLFYSRFTPSQPIELWERLREGGPAQQAAMQKACGRHDRFFEEAVNFQKRVFPNALPCLYGLNLVQGYSALQPRSLFNQSSLSPSFPVAWIADWKIQADGTPDHFLRSSASNESCRFIWRGPFPRLAKIVSEAPGRLVVSVAPGPAGQLIRTDTDYPGWRAWGIGGQLAIKSLPPCFSFVELPDAKTSLTLFFEFSPRFLPVGLAGTVVGLLGMVLTAIVFGRKF